MKKTATAIALAFALATIAAPAFAAKKHHKAPTKTSQPAGKGKKA